MSNRLRHADWGDALRRLANRLKQMRPGEVITIAEISRVVGYEMGHRRSIFYAAEKVAAVEAGMAFKSEHNQGYRCTHRTGGAYNLAPQSDLPLQIAEPETPPKPSDKSIPDAPEDDTEADWQELKVRLGTAAIMVIEHWMRRP
jgi:hypothetical protein